MREGRLGKHRDLGAVTEIGQRGVEVFRSFDEPDGLGRHGQGADGFVVAGVADVQDGEALAHADAGLVVHLGDERADRVHNVATFGAGGGDNVGRRTVRRQHEGRAGRDVGDVVDEDHSLLAEALHDEPVVDDLVVAVDGRLERPDHPCQRFDRHLDPGTEAPRLGEQHGLDRSAGGRSHRREGTSGRSRRKARAHSP